MHTPQLPDFGKPITVAQLLWHTSGIRDAYDGLIAAGWRWNDVISVDDMMKFILRQKELNFAPGSEFSYCNTEYILLQQIVEKVSGTPFAHYADSAIFKPMGMNASFFEDNYAKIIPRPANPYTPTDHGFERQEQQTSGLPMFSTLDDLCKWTIYFNRMMAAKNPVYTRMAAEGILNNGQKTGYGFGLMLSEDRGLKMIWHTGAWGGFRAVIKNYYTEGLSIIILSNGNDDAINVGYSSKVADIFLRDKFHEEPKIDAAKLPDVEVDTTLLKRYAGTYKFGSGEITITLEQGQLMLQYTGESKYPTKALSDSSFLVIVAGLPLTFSKTQGGQVNTFTFRSIVGKRVVPFDLTREQLAAYSGSYYCPELFAEYTVDIQQGKLFIHHFRRGDFEISPDGQDEFSSDIGDIHFIKNGSNQIAGFTLSEERIKNLRFEKTK